ncbi:MAG TPA: arylsulfatase, partial [Spirochaetia bacterium]|nr:arylsulfatase [Spirochaetia bacterium]
MTYKITLLLVMLGATLCATASQQPNVIVILADDMGYGDVHALNPDSVIPTPNLDRLSMEG